MSRTTLQQSLVSPANDYEIAKQLSELLEKLSFDDGLTRRLAEKKAALRNKTMHAVDYLNDECIQTVTAVIQKRTYHFLPAMLHIFWYTKADPLSKTEKAVLMVDVLLWIPMLVLLHDPLVMLLWGKRVLKDTGKGIANTCNGLGLSIASICAGLEPNQTVLVDMSRQDVMAGIRNITVTDLVNGPIPDVCINKINTLTAGSLEWFNFLVCGKSADGIWTQIVGHAYTGSKDKHGIFPVGQDLVLWDADTMQSALQVAAKTAGVLLQMCLEFIYKPGSSSVLNAQGIAYGHTDGFKVGADQFEMSFDRFSTPYLVFTGLVVLTMLGFGVKKIISKWQNSAGERAEYPLIKEVSRSDLFSKIAAIDSVFQGNVDDSIASLTSRSPINSRSLRTPSPEATP